MPTDNGKKAFAVHDRLRFLRNERDLGVKNGSLGTVEGIESGVLQIKLDGVAGAHVTVDATDDFAGRAYDATPERVEARFTATLGRERAKEFAYNYLERDTIPAASLVESLVARQRDENRTRQPSATTPPASPTHDLNARQQSAAAGRWAARQQEGPQPWEGARPANSPNPSPIFRKALSYGAMDRKMILSCNQLRVCNRLG